MQYTIALLVCMLVVTKGIPSDSHKRPITFSTQKTIDYEKIHYNDYVPAEGSQEYYENLRIVAVTHDGYEYTESLEEAMARLSSATVEGANQLPSQQDDPTSQDPEDPMQDPAGQDGVFQLLANAMQKEMPEKRSVIGDDTRTRVNNPAGGFPFTAIGRIDFGCTGTFIAPRTILTSAHCVHSGGNGGQWYDQLNFRRRKNCDPDNGVTHTWKQAVSFTAWTRNKLKAYDIAIITVHQASPVVMVFASADSIPLEMVNIFGYPGDKRNPDNCMWHSWCTLTQVTDNYLRYPCDTSRGMSGSAVYKFWTPNTRIIYGIHGYGGSSNNEAIRITSEIENGFRGAIPSYGGD